MTQPTLTVEQEELLARAEELEAAIASAPAEFLLPVCQLADAGVAAEALADSATNMRTRLAEAQQEWAKLAESLRNAARAYGDIDAGAGQDINNAV